MLYRLRVAWDAVAWTEQDRIRKAREAAGLSLSELGEAAGVARHTLGRWESGERSPQRATIAAVVRILADRLDLPETELAAWIRTGEPTP